MDKRASLTFSVCLSLFSASCVLDRSPLDPPCVEQGTCAYDDDEELPPRLGSGSGGGGDSAAADGGSSAPDAAPIADATSVPDPTVLATVKPAAEKLPKAKQSCPELREGTVTFAGTPVRLWMGSDGDSKLGPLVFYWHAADGDVGEIISGLGSETIEKIKALGGMVAALEKSSEQGVATGTYWHTGDLAIADEVVACAIASGVGVDPGRIHSLGFSGGALQTTYMAYARSNYLASVVTYSGGINSWWSTPQLQDPANVVPAMVVHGKLGEDFRLMDFSLSSAAYTKNIRERGGFALDCTHDVGHHIPEGVGPAALRFLLDHAYKVSPSPYAAAMPASMPGYCKVP